MLENLMVSLKVLVLGLAAVFLGLTLLIIFVELMHKIISNNKEKDNRKPSISNNFKAGKPEETQITTDNADMSEDDELIAVISAAVAAALNRSTHDIVVKSLRRIESHSPIWNRVSRQEQIGTRL